MGEDSPNRAKIAVNSLRLVAFFEEMILKAGDNRRGNIVEANDVIIFEERDKNLIDKVEIDATGFLRQEAITNGIGGQIGRPLRVIGIEDKEDIIGGPSFEEVGGDEAVSIFSGEGDGLVIGIGMSIPLGRE
jgi:hypothetical protein